jgi:hypothetical protein
MTEQTISVELTKSQYLHLQSILKQDKPSRTRLSRGEKNYILTLLSHEVDAMAGYSDKDKDEHYYDRQRYVDCIRKKLI